MSAFIVGNEHISAMLQIAQRGSPGDGARYYWDEASHYFNGNLREVGQKLVDENYRSVNYRYDDSRQPHTFKLVGMIGDRSPVEIIKACHCYMYQACEHPEWQESEAYAIVKALEKRAMRFLPGYDEADWEITL